MKLLLIAIGQWMDRIQPRVEELVIPQPGETRTILGGTEYCNTNYTGEYERVCEAYYYWNKLILSDNVKVQLLAKKMADRAYIQVRSNSFGHRFYN